METEMSNKPTRKISSKPNTNKWRM